MGLYTKLGCRWQLSCVDIQRSVCMALRHALLIRNGSLVAQAGAAVERANGETLQVTLHEILAGFEALWS